MWFVYVIAAVLVLALAIGVWDARWRSSQARTNLEAGGVQAGIAEGHDSKRAEAAKASQTAEFYSHLAAEQEARAEELIEESEQAAEREGLDDARTRHLEPGS